MKIAIEDSLLKLIRSDMREFLRCVNSGGIRKHRDSYGCSEDACYAIGDFADHAIDSITAALRSTAGKEEK